MIKYISYSVLAIVITLTLIKVTEPQNKAYNKYMCANYGYEEDCKTPLPEDRRLK